VSTAVKLSQKTTLPVVLSRQPSMQRSRGF
jgi:hypothetical protein